MFNRKELKKNVKVKFHNQLLMSIVVTLIALLLLGAIPLLTLPVMIGLIVIYKDVLLGQNVSVDKLFIGYKNLNRAVEVSVAYLVYGLICALGFIFFVIPGIILSLMYSQVIYLMIKDPKCSIGQAFKQSKEMMKGHKWEKFVLGLSFIGHFLLVIITFGVWSLYLTPYMQMTDLAYHEHLTKKS